MEVSKATNSKGGIEYGRPRKKKSNIRDREEQTCNLDSKLRLTLHLPF